MVGRVLRTRVASASPAASAWACSPPSPSSCPPTSRAWRQGGHPASAARYAQPWNIVLADDPDAAWPRISEHLAYAWDSYGRYMVEGTDQPLPPPVDPEQMRVVGSGMGDAGAFFMVLDAGAGRRLPARRGRADPVGGDVLLDQHRGHARRPRGAPRGAAVHGAASAGRRPRRVSQAVASSACERPVASSRSSWNCIQTVWYESQAGDANHSRLPGGEQRQRVVEARLVAGEAGNRGTSAARMPIAPECTTRRRSTTRSSYAGSVWSLGIRRARSASRGTPSATAG